MTSYTLPSTDGAFDGVSASDLLGQLCAIKGKEPLTKATKNGPRDAINADVFIIEDDGTMTDKGEVLFFWSVFVKELTANLGKWMVGRPTMAEGKSYYVLALPEAEEMELVDAAMAAFSGGTDEEPF